MIREPDWESLSEINFLMSRRMVDQLNDALAALDQIPSSEDQTRATTAVTAALNLHSAWADMIRYKVGQTPLFSGPQQFRAGDLLEWIVEGLQVADFPTSEADLRLRGNRATIQEALLLLQSCAHTLGPGVHVRAEKHRHGLWFRVCYGAVSDAPDTLEELLARLRANWRLQSAAFELRSARDFLVMNGCELHYTIAERECQLAFFLWTVQPANGEPNAKEKAKTLLDTYNAEDTYRVITD